jgi:hypothetical protein
VVEDFEGVGSCQGFPASRQLPTLAFSLARARMFAMSKKFLLQIMIALLSLSTTFAYANFDLDVDDDGKTSPLTDGLLVVRYMFGFSGASLVADAVSNTASRSSSVDIANHLKANEAQLDIDGDGEVGALTDGLLIIRSLFGYSGKPLQAGAIGANASRTDGNAIETYLETITDSDNDNVNDAFDTFPNNTTEWLDTDGDGFGNNADPDDDGDGILDDEVAFRDGFLCIDANEACYEIVGKTYLYSKKWKDSFYVLLYDGSKNIAGSSGLSGYFDGLELYSISDDQFTYLGNYFYESSIDSFFRGVTSEESLVICASAECFVFFSDGTNFRFRTAEVGLNLLVTGLKKNVTESGYLIYLKEGHSAEASGELDELEYKAFSIQVDQKLLRKSITEISHQEILDQIKSEISNIRQPFFLRQNNLEGRVSWGQHYILDWYLLSLQEAELEWSSSDLLHANFKFYFDQGISELLTSKRYSVDRAEALFLLHISRQYQLVVSYLELFGSSHYDLEKDAILQRFRDLLDPNSCQTIECLKLKYFEELGETRTYLEFTFGSVFWADGANVPMNYTSDYITAIVLSGQEEQLLLAENLLKTHIDLIGASLPQSWNYWYADGQEGWKEGSLNTESYDGDQSGNAADITYRTSDALAFLTWCKKFPDYKRHFDCKIIKSKIYGLVLVGNLEPHLKRFFDDQPELILNDVVASKFSRLTFTNDLRNILFVE